GKYYTPRYRLSYGNHGEIIAFEIFELEEGIDGILPAWWVEKHSPSNFVNGEMVFESDYCEKHCLYFGLLHYTEEQDVEDIVVSAITAKSVDPMEPFEDMSEEERRELMSTVPEVYHDLLKPFSKEFADRLPEHTEYDHAIDLMPGTTPPSCNIYPMSANELKTLDGDLKDMERTGKIRKSVSSAGAPAIFVPKADNELRFCVDYRRLNSITIKNRYPLPLMDELRDRLHGSVYKTKLDLKNGYHLIRIKEGDEWKTAFRTRYGHYEYTVMPFGLVNAPATFQNMINSILRELLDEGVIAYLDDILIYSRTMEEHIKLVREVLKRLYKAGLAINPKKSVFHAKEVEFLGYIIGTDGVKMSPKKVETILQWRPPQSVKDVQSFMGFANFYRRFIKNFSGIAKPITNLTKDADDKSKPFVWTLEADKAFEHLKRIFTTAPILAHFDPSKQIVIEADASDFAIGAVLSIVID